MNKEHKKYIEFIENKLVQWISKTMDKQVELGLNEYLNKEMKKFQDGKWKVKIKTNEK